MPLAENGIKPKFLFKFYSIKKLPFLLPLLQKKGAKLNEKVFVEFL
jgi:hypothetical protein|tara:strand:+ start:628 stop:765 length:138 start_codon:yes stop_codon:yes gene_type:complete